MALEFLPACFRVVVSVSVIGLSRKLLKRDEDRCDEKRDGVAIQALGCGNLPLPDRPQRLIPTHTSRSFIEIIASASLG